MDLDPVIAKAKVWALEEIKTNGTPAVEHFNLSNDKGQELARKMNADVQIVMLGTILMDVKLGECLKEGNVKEHIKRSADASREFLDKFEIDDKTKLKIIGCVEAHHGTKDFSCIESEICANADCYRFIHPRGVFAYFKLLGKRYEDFSDVIKSVKTKMEEKKRILSLDICKKELEPHYDTFQLLFSEL